MGPEEAVNFVSSLSTVPGIIGLGIVATVTAIIFWREIKRKNLPKE